MYVDPARSSLALLFQSTLEVSSSTPVGFDVTTMTTELVILLVCVVFSAIFSSSEVAFFSIKSHDLTEKIKNGNIGLIRVQYLTEHPRQLLSTILIGNTVVNLLASVMAAMITMSLIAYFNWPTLLVYTIEVILITAIIVIFGEISPKVIGIKNPYKVATLFSPFIYVLFVILKPINKIIAASSMSLERRMPKPKNRITESDLFTLAEVGEQEGHLREDEREIIENVVEFGNTEVREIMTSRVDIEFVTIDDTLGEVLERIRTLRISRLPLCDPDLDTIIGIMYSKDLLRYANNTAAETDFNWKSLARKPLFIPVNKKLDDLLADFQREKTHMAIVVDEYGGTEGLVTLDDVLEEIMGELETDPEVQDEIRQLRNGDYIIDAKVDLDELNDLFGAEIATDEDEYETLGGLVYHVMERIPTVGEKIRVRDLEITVQELENNRIKRLRVRAIKKEDAKDTLHNTSD